MFGLSDILLVALAFQAAYQTRSILQLEHNFFLTVEKKALVLGSSLVAWVTIGLWLEVYEKLDSGHPRVILRDSARRVRDIGVEETAATLFLSTQKLAAKNRDSIRASQYSSNRLFS